MRRYKSPLNRPAPPSPPKPRYTSSANLYHKEVVAPLEKKWRHALKKKNYDEASAIFQELLEKRKYHRVLVKRSEKVLIKHA